MQKLGGIDLFEDTCRCRSPLRMGKGQDIVATPVMG